MSALLKRYGPWVDQGPISTDPAKVRMRVLAIPQAGMGAWAFHGWSLPETVELLPVELPGRNSRMLEPKGQSMRQLVTALVDALANTLRETPFVVFGHSLGAWMACEVCVELAQRGGPRPVGLVVSGARAPQLADPENDADRVHITMPAAPRGHEHLSDDDLRDAAGGCDPGMQSFNTTVTPNRTCHAC